MSFLPSHVDDVANINGKAGRIVVTWNRFARSLRDAVEFYTETKQAEFNAFIESIPAFVKENIPIKKLLIALIPYLTYLIFYSNYSLVRQLTGLDEQLKPNLDFLPWLEYLVFRCYPHRILSQFASTYLDFLAAVPYLIHFPLPALFALYLLASPRRRDHIYAFAWCAGWVNLCALAIQYLFPTAPPWFVDSAVFDAHGVLLKEAPNEAGFQRLDAFFGVGFFRGIYSASPLKFGAFPSLHVAWPAIILVNHPWMGKKFAWFHVIWITWAALYSKHHFAVDAVAGVLLVFIVNFSMIQIWSPFNGRTTKRTVVNSSSKKSRTSSDEDDGKGCLVRDI